MTPAWKQKGMSWWHSSSFLCLIKTRNMGDQGHRVRIGNLGATG